MFGLDDFELYSGHEARHHPDADDDDLVAQVATVPVKRKPDGTIPVNVTHVTL